MSDVLFCFTQGDREIARSCADRIAEAGIKVKADSAVAALVRLDTRLRPDVLGAKAVVAIMSESALRSRQMMDEIGAAAATARLIIVTTGGLPPEKLPSELRDFHVGSRSDTARIIAALAALGVSGRGADGKPTSATASKAEDSKLEALAWSYVRSKNSAKLVQMFLNRFPDGTHDEPARILLAELTVPDEGGIRLSTLMAGVVLIFVTVTLVLAMLLPTRTTVKVPVAAGGSDGMFLRMVGRYNDHLRPLGVELVANRDAKNAFTNMQQLTEGRVKAAFVKGGFAGALRDPDYLTEERVKLRGEDWNQDWTAKLDQVQSLGRVSLEPLWVFTFGGAERNQLAELDGETVGLGSMQSGGRTLASLLLEKNGVRARQELWLDSDPPTPEPGDPKPLGAARAIFLQQPAESPQVQALLRNLAPERQYDKTKNIRAAAFTPKGESIAVALGDMTVRVIDAFTGEEIASLKGHTQDINDVAFSPDGKRIVTGSDDDTARVWDAATGHQIGEPLKSSASDVNGVAFSPDGKRIVAASEDDRATIYDVATGKVIVHLEGKDDQPGHTNDLNSAVFSPDGKRVVTASRDGTARVWDASNGSQQIILRGHTKPVSRAVFSKDGRLIATASWDNTGRIWDAKTGRIRMILQGHQDILRSVEFSPDSKWVITASWDDSARIWDVATGREIRHINGIRSNVNGVGFSPDGAVAMTASQDTTVRIWDTKTWEKVADFHADGETDAGGTNDSSNALHLMDFSKDADAYMSRFPFLSTVRLPRGAVNFEPHVPAEAVTLLATSVAFIVDKTWAEKNPSLVRVLTDAIVHKPITGLDEVTRKPRLFFKSGQFPSASDPEYEMSPLAPPIYRTGDLPLILSRLARLSVVPFAWAAWLDEHAGTLVFSLIPLLGVLIPLVRLVPTIYNWTIRRRILYWYRRLHALERQLDQEDRSARPLSGTHEIERIDGAVSKIRVPLSYTDQYFDLRAHIDLVRQRIIARVAAGPRSGARVV